MYFFLSNSEYYWQEDASSNYANFKDFGTEGLKVVQKFCAEVKLQFDLGEDNSKSFSSSSDSHITHAWRGSYMSKA